jgi:hypothetical protein
MQFRKLSAAVIAGACLAQAASQTSNIEPKPDQAGRLLNEIKVNAQQIRSAASDLEALAKNHNAKWQDYDGKWNMIKPSQERIDLATQRLEAMQASLTPAEQQALTQAKHDSGIIAAATRDLRITIGQGTSDVPVSAVSTNARRLEIAARALSRTISSTT